MSITQKKLRVIAIDPFMDGVSGQRLSEWMMANRAQCGWRPVGGVGGVANDFLAFLNNCLGTTDAGQPAYVLEQSLYTNTVRVVNVAVPGNSQGRNCDTP